jgi:hypothetical protein
LLKQTQEVIMEVEAAAVLPWPRIQRQHALPLQDFNPLHAVILVADASWRPEHAHTMRRRHLLNLALSLVIAGLRAVASLQLEPPIVGSMDLKPLMVGKPVSHEMGTIPEIASRTAV